MTDNGSASLRVNEEIFALGDIWDIDGRTPVHSRKNVSGSKKLQSISETDLATMLRDLVERRVCDVEILCLGAKSNYSLDFIGRVGVCWYDEKTGK